MKIQNELIYNKVEKTLPLNIYLNNNIYYFKNRHYMFRYNRSIYNIYT